MEEQEATNESRPHRKVGAGRERIKLHTKVKSKKPAQESSYIEVELKTEAEK